MFYEILKFELNYHRQQYAFYVMSGIVFLLFFLATSTPNVSIGGSGPNLNLNGSLVVINSLGAVSFISILLSIAFTANSVIRDYEFKTIELFLSRPLSKRGFIYGRFFGSFVFGVLVYLAGLMGVLLGEFMPWLDPERLGAFSFTPYVYGTLVLGLPNLLIFSAIFFCITALTRSLAYTYVAAVGLLMLSFLVDFYTDKDTVQLTSFLDPFGSVAIEDMTRYWTPFESNSNLPPLEGSILFNRLLWLGVGVVFIGLAYRLFPFSINRSRKQPAASKPEQLESTSAVKAKVSVQQQFGFRSEIGQYWSQTRLEVRNIVTSVPFIVIMLLGMVQVVSAAAGNLGNVFGTPVYPTTINMIEVINGVFTLSLLAVLVYMSGEMMSRERSTHSHEIMDAMPYPNWIMIGAKWSGLAIVVILMLLSVIVAAMAFQFAKGFTDINILQYLVGLLFFFQLPLYLMVTLSVFFYVLVRNKYFAMFLMIVYVVSALALPNMGFEHYLYRLDQVGMVYSDFTGYNQNLAGHLWQTFYWGLFGCLLLLVSHLLWPRGSEDHWKNRVKSIRDRMTQPVVISIWAASTGFLLVGGFIYYNTNVLNVYQTREDTEVLQADYEKAFKQYENMTVPGLKKVYVDVDIYPERREVEASGYYEMINTSDAPIEQVHFSDPVGVEVLRLSLPASSLAFDERLGYRIYTLEEPLQPGQEMKVEFDVAWLTPGFANNGHTPKLASNGTFFNNTDLFPMQGYQSGNEIQDNNTRREQGLSPVERQRDLDDPMGRESVGFYSDSRVEFETVVSTSVGQIAIAPGYLQKDWQEAGRHYYHYKMDSPIWNFMSFVSADYRVKRDVWNDVAIEIYYLHDYNIDTMIASTKDSLEYFSKNFSPYQYRQFRIMEFPRFQGRFAQSFPNTIPFSESIGFTADLRDKTEIDTVYYVTAHELAHQWWAHQVLGANVQGSTMLVETLSQYSALMVMEQTYGADRMKQFLSFELDRYLQGRGGEIIEELPLYRVENQPYIHYQKGSLVFYALKDLMGAEAINDALATFTDQYAFKGAPFPTTRDLLALLRERADPIYADTITDLFEKIVLFDVKVDEVEMTELADGGYEVTFDVIASKYEANGEGFETEVPISDWIDIAVLGEKQGESEIPEILYIEKAHIVKNADSFTIRLNEKPVSVGIDPLNKLVDRNPDDNVKDV